MDECAIVVGGGAVVVPGVMGRSAGRTGVTFNAASARDGEGGVYAEFGGRPAGGFKFERG